MSISFFNILFKTGWFRNKFSGSDLFDYCQYLLSDVNTHSVRASAELDVLIIAADCWVAF